jgi:threonine/homoserine/homoserine lactone efflux protein
VIPAFLAVSLLVIVTPGPDTALTIRNTLVGGRRSGIFTALGVATGQAVWALATSAGVAALLVASEPVFDAIKLAGAAYLVLLGVQALRSSFFPGHSGLDNPEPSRGLAPTRALRQGLLSNLGNPKMAVFFTSLLPQFGAESFGGLLVLGLVFCALTFVWLSGYAFVVGRIGDVLRRPVVRRVFDAVLGTVLVALGFRLAAERR